MNDEMKFLVGLSISAAITAGALLGKWFWNRSVMRRCAIAVTLIARRWSGKHVRHRPTGEVGLCMGGGVMSRKRWGFMQTIEVVHVVVCHECIRAARAGLITGPALLQNLRCSRVFPVGAVAPALELEINAFKALDRGEEAS